MATECIWQNLSVFMQKHDFKVVLVEFNILAPVLLNLVIPF